MKNLKSNEKFAVLTVKEMSTTEGGWKFFGKESDCGGYKSIVGNYSQQLCTDTTYAFGFQTGSSQSFNADGID